MTMLTLDVRPVADYPPEERVRIMPEDWYSFRATHDFRFPCCLCARHKQGSYTKTVVRVDTVGQYTGQYVTTCTENRCGYISEFLHSHISVC